MPDTEKQEKTTISFSGSMGWIFGVIFLVGGVPLLFSGSVIAGLGSVAAGFVAIPRLANAWQEKLGIELSTGVTFILVLVLMGVSGSFLPDDGSQPAHTTSNQANNQQQQQGTTAQNSSNKQPNDQSDPVVEETAGQVYAEFQNNEIAAEEKYNNGVRITGTVDGVGEDVMSNPYVSLYSANEFEYVQAMIAEQSQDMLNSLNSGQRLTVECQSVSSSLGSPLANSCVIVQ